MIGYTIVIGLAFVLLLGIALSVNTLENTVKSDFAKIASENICNNLKMAVNKMESSYDPRSVHTNLDGQVVSQDVLYFPEQISGKSWELIGENNSFIIHQLNSSKTCQTSLHVVGKSSGGKIKLVMKEVSGSFEVEVSPWP